MFRYSPVNFGCYRKSDWNNKHLFVTVLVAGKSRIMVQADMVTGDGSPLGL